MNAPAAAALAGAAPAVDNPDEGLDRRRLATVAAQAASLRWQIVATAAVIAALVWEFVPAPWIIAWLALVIGVREWRARRLTAMVADSAEPVARQLPRVVAWNAAIGVSNGAAALFMAWLDPARDAVLTMIVVSWAAGAVSTSAPLLRAYLVFSLCVLLPVAAMWLITGTPLGLAVAALVLMFAGVQYRFARHNAEVFEASYRIRMENEELVRELAAARDVAEAANRAKSRFLAVASHDLRQPLHALTLHSGALAQDPYAADAPDIAREISSAIESLAQLLDSLLDISKLDAGVVVVQRRTIRLGRLIALVVRSELPQAAAKGVRLRCECPADAVVHTDPVLLERLLRNLVDNAVKYTDSGEIWVQARGDHDALRLMVRDTGRGIPDAAQAQVFDEFFQVDPTDGARQPGLGLGLAIVRRLAQLLELPLTLSSTEGVGTTVGLRIERAAVAADDAAASALPAFEIRGLKVLLIDDDAAVRRAMRHVLVQLGCEVDDRANGAEALDAAARRSPDLVIADWRLGTGASGVAVVRRLRERHPQLPALLISGETDPDHLRRADEAGLTLLHKPVTLARLQAAIGAVMRDAGTTPGAGPASSSASVTPLGITP